MSGYLLQAGARVRLAYGSEAWAFARKREKVRVISRVVVCCCEPGRCRLAGGPVHSISIYLRGSHRPVSIFDLVPA